MRIDDRNAITGSTAGRTAEVDQTQAKSGKAVNGFSRLNSDSVELSGASLSISNFNSARDVRLQQLEKAVQGGSFSVNPALVSRALVTETLANGQTS